MKPGGFLFPLLSVVDFAEGWWVGVHGGGVPKSIAEVEEQLSQTSRPGTQPGPEHLQQEQRKKTKHLYLNKSGIQSYWIMKLQSTHLTSQSKQTQNFNVLSCEINYNSIVQPLMREDSNRPPCSRICQRHLQTMNSDQEILQKTGIYSSSPTYNKKSPKTYASNTINVAAEHWPKVKALSGVLQDIISLSFWQFFDDKLGKYDKEKSWNTEWG